MGRKGLHAASAVGESLYKLGEQEKNCFSFSKISEDSVSALDSEAGVIPVMCVGWQTMQGRRLSSRTKCLEEKA